MRNSLYIVFISVFGVSFAQSSELNMIKNHCSVLGVLKFSGKTQIVEIKEINEKVTAYEYECVKVFKGKARQIELFSLVPKRNHRGYCLVVKSKTLTKDSLRAIYFSREQLDQVPFPSIRVTFSDLLVNPENELDRKQDEKKLPTRHSHD